MVLAGINFSDGVMVKSYLGFGMTHIREEVSDGQQSGGPIHIYIYIYYYVIRYAESYLVWYHGILLSSILSYITIIYYPIIYYVPHIRHTSDQLADQITPDMDDIWLMGGPQGVLRWYRFQLLHERPGGQLDTAVKTRKKYVMWV